MTVIDEFEEEFKKFTGAKHAVACSSGTAALHTAVHLCGIRKGDKVITTPFSFIASSNCILYEGGIPVFADINPETYCLNPYEVEEKAKENPDAKAVLAVHLFGNPCDLDHLIEICKKHNLVLIEDCAQALGARFKKVHVGNFGLFGCFSFYATKNLWTFEGGMIVTYSSIQQFMAREFINHGQHGKYNHVSLGFNYRMPQICALIGLTSLKLHKKSILAELGNFGVKQGHYPEVIYNQPLYRRLGIKGDCPNAEKAALEARKWLNQ